MLTYGVPILFALGIWWGSTIAILVLDGCDRKTYPWSLATVSLLTLFAFVGIFAGRGDRSVAGAYHAFTCGIIAWAWQILTFYMGFITGPSRSPCDPRWRGWRRFVGALRICLYHELATVFMAIFILALSWKATNHLALWTYLVLWWMHLSAKLNVFFGVRNRGEDLIPHQLRYILTYMPKRGMNAFFPISVLVSTTLTISLIHAAARAADAFGAAALTMLSTLMVLAIVEHWFLVTPFDAEFLWRWGAKKSPATSVTTARQPLTERIDRAPTVRPMRDTKLPSPEPIELKCV